MKKNSQGRKNKKTILLNYRTWVIECDNNFPSYNYILKKVTDKKGYHVAYCGTLESALTKIYEIMLLDFVNKQNNYGAKFNDLANAIKTTKKELSDILNLNPLFKERIKAENTHNATG